MDHHIIPQELKSAFAELFARAFPGAEYPQKQIAKDAHVVTTLGDTHSGGKRFVHEADVGGVCVPK